MSNALREVEATKKTLTRFGKLKRSSRCEFNVESQFHREFRINGTELFFTLSSSTQRIFCWLYLTKSTCVSSCLEHEMFVRFVRIVSLFALLLLTVEGHRHRLGYNVSRGDYGLNRTAMESPSDEETIEFGFWRPGATFNDPAALLVDTPEECHRHCGLSDSCITWSRDRRTGACALKNKESPFVREPNYDSGVVDGVPATQTTLFTACYVERGVRYPAGEVLDTRSTRTVDECCELCRQDVNCFSWHRSRRSRTCVMNRNVPQKTSRSAFDGAALV